MIDTAHHEKHFEHYIVEKLKAQDWLVGTTSGYNIEHALYPEDLVAWLQDTQDDKWKKLVAANATKATEVLTCLSADSRAQVDDTLAKALAAGAKPWKPILDMGPMYGCSFQDLDGHVWELMYMDQAAMAEMGEAAQAGA